MKKLLFFLIVICIPLSSYAENCDEMFADIIRNNQNSILPKICHDAIAGNASSQTLFGLWYETQKNYPKAVKWYTKAAEQGQVGSYLVLGALHSQVETGVQDLDLAKKYLKLSCENDQPIGCNMLKEIDEKKL